MMMLLGVSGFLLVLAAAAPVGESVNLTDVRYTPQVGSSRVTLQFDGEVRYSRLGSDGVVRLGFSHTRTAIPPKIRRQLLTSGLVTAITVTPVGGDSLVVAVMLRAGTTYRCVMPSSGNALYIDVAPNGGQASPARFVPVRIAPAKLPPQRPAAPVRASAAAADVSAPAQTSTSSMVDIPAIAREQVLAEVRSSAHGGHEGAPGHQPLAPLMVFGLSVVAVLIPAGSTAALVMSFRKKTPRAAAASRPMPAPYVTPMPERDSYAGRTTVQSETLLEEPEPDDESGYEHETSLQLARTFRRGSEEITLARRMHDHTAPQLSHARMEETLTRAGTPTQRLHFARKLGVGRGEMDLAVKLRTMRTAEKKEEVEL
jgi:hypothetical protein